MPPTSPGVRLDPVTRRFADPTLERAYQLEAGLSLRSPIGAGQLFAPVDPTVTTGAVASRMESHGVEGRVQISRATWLLVRGRIDVEERGPIEVKGRGLMRTFLVRRGPPDPATGAHRTPTATDAVGASA